MTPYRVFIGYDPREASCYHVCQQSIIEHCAEPSRLEFHPVTGERRDGSNDFIYARFDVPRLCEYKGTAVFLDGDMLARADIGELFALDMMGLGVRVVQHNYKTKHPVKYLGNKNDDYPRKNWSSVVLWNCNYYPHRKLTTKFVREHDGSYLHRFSWLSDEQIGALPSGWNRLVLEEDLRADDKLRHFTIGAPCFSEYADCDGAEEWHSTTKRMLTPWP